MTETRYSPATPLRHRPGRHRTARRRTAAAVVVSLLLVAAGCAEDGAGESTASSTGDGVTAADSTTTDTTTETTVESTTTDTTAETTSSSTSSATSTTLAGEPLDGFARDGDVLGVMGVAFDDELNVRAGPGTGTAVVTTVGPTADDLVATGRARLLPRSIWYEVEANGRTGWVSVAFVAFIGMTDDATAEFLKGEPPIESETMMDLGLAVAEGFASEDPASRIVQSVAPSGGDLGEVTYDVVGIGDDSIGGYRLHVFGAPTGSGDGFSLKSIERTWFCSRGSSGDLCV